MARIFVTGGSGFVGAHILRALQERGHRVTCLSRRKPPLQGLDEATVEWIRADLHDTAAYVRTLSGVDHVIHLASLLAARRKTEYFRTNVEGTRALIGACMKAGQRLRGFVHMSSIAAMGPAENGGLLTEDSPCRPRTEYGASKLAAEKVILEASVSWPVVVLRPSLVYGIGDERGAALLRDLLGPRPSASRLTVSRISVCHVLDVVHACLLALEQRNDATSTFLIAEPKSYGWPEIDDIVARSLRGLTMSGDVEVGERAGKLLESLRKAQRRSPPNSERECWGCDTSRAERELGFRATHSLGESAGEVIESYLKDRRLSWPGSTVVREA